MTETTTPATPVPTFGERLDALTGRDELAILAAFGHDVWDTYDALFENEEDERTSKKISGRIARMLVFADKLHAGLPAAMAYESILDMTATDVNAYLRFDETGEPPRETPESGKDESTDV